MPNITKIVKDPNISNTDNTKAVSRLVSMALMMANGIVWVLPVRFPANMIVAPNSDIARAHDRASPVRSDGAAKGIVTRQNVHQGDTPKVREMSSWSVATDWNPNLADLTKKGDATNIWARITAAVVNGRVMPRSSRGGPKKPRRPKAINMATPATTGGITNGSSTNASTSLSKGDLLRANR